MTDASTRPLVDPELLPMLEFGDMLNLSPETLPLARAALEGMIGARPPEPQPVIRREVELPTLDGTATIRLLVYTPEGPATLRPAICHVHGGGFVLGSAAMSDAGNRANAANFDAVVVAVDYRLAPETPYPGPVDDCWAGLCWMREHAAELGIDPARIVLLGESAGGGLAAALALVNRDRGGAPLAGQVLVYPMLDHRTGTHYEPDPDPNVGEFTWTRAYNRFGWDAMQGDGAPGGATFGHFSPAGASSLAGLPATFIAVGSLDLFLHEDIAWASRLMRSRVPTELHVYPGAVHAFDSVATAAVTRQFATDRGRALRRMLGGTAD